MRYNYLKLIFRRKYIDFICVFNQRLSKKSFKVVRNEKNTGLLYVNHPLFSLCKNLDAKGKLSENNLPNLILRKLYTFFSTILLSILLPDCGTC